MIINAAMTRDQPASEDGQNWQYCAADRGDLATLKAAQIRRSDFLPEQWKRLHMGADRFERTVRKYAWLCIKRAHG